MKEWTLAQLIQEIEPRIKKMESTSEETGDLERLLRCLLRQFQKRGNISARETFLPINLHPVLERVLDWRHAVVTVGDTSKAVPNS